jgi:hypothetical protein
MFLPSTGAGTSPSGLQSEYGHATGDEPRSLPIERLEHEIASLAAHISATTCRWLLLVAEFDRRDAHEAWGFHSCAGWLSWRCSVAPRAAREHLRVARRLDELPLVRETFSHGELSYSKVRAISRIAKPEQEAELLELARHATAAQLERVVRGYRRAVSLESAQDAEERRHLSFSWEEDGSLSFRGRLTPEEGALFVAAIEAAREAADDESLTGTDGGPAEPPRHSGKNADAVVTMAETLLASGPAARTGGERHQVVVHADAEVLSEDAAEGRCEIDGGPPICPETARRIACDASIVRMHEDRSGLLNIGRKTRAIPPAIRRALRGRDGGCRFPGCTNHRWVDAHHIRHWADGGETALDNLVHLCRRHHRLLHEGGFTLECRADGRLRFRRPDGKPLPVAPAPPARSSRPRLNTDRVAAIPLPLSAGEPMDLDLTVAGLLARAGPAP